MNPIRSILLFGLEGGTERHPLLDDAARLAVGRCARLVVCDTKPPAQTCARRPKGHRTKASDVVDTVAGCADAIRATLVVVAIGARQSDIAIDLGRLMRACKRDVLVMSHPVTMGCVVAAVDPSAGEAVNAAVLGTALAHSHLHGGDLHIVGEADDGASCAAMADLLEPICRLDSSRMHVAGGDLLQSVGAFVREADAGLVVLGPFARSSTDEPVRSLRHILPHSSVMVVHSPSATSGSVSADARSGARRRTCQ